MGEVINIASLRAKRRRRQEREAFEAKREAMHREASERLHRLLDGNWPPPGGHAA